MLLPPLVALVPLIIAPGLLFYFDVTPKIVLLLIGAGAGLFLFRPRRLTVPREGKWLLILLAIQAASLALSTALSMRVSTSVFGTNWRRFGLVAQLATLLFTALAAADLAGGRLRLYLRAITVTAIPISVYGIAQYFGWDPWLPKEAYHIGEGIWTIVRPPGTLGYVSYFANYLVFIVFFGAALYSMDTGWWKRAGAVAAGVAAFAIVLSGTRGAMLAMLAGAIYAAIGLRREIGMRTIAIGIGAVAALGLFIVSPGGQMMRSRFRWYVEDARGGARLLLFRDSIVFGASHFLTGIGPEAFSAEFPQVQSAELSRAYPDFYHESPHNIFLDSFTAQGIIGAAALIAFVGLGFYAERRSSTTESTILGACLVAGLVAHQFTVFTAPTALYFYLVAAMLAALKAPEIPATRLPWYAAAPVSIALLVFAGRLLWADSELQRVKVDVAVGNRQDAILRYNRVRELGLNADIWYSNQMAAQALRAPEIVEKLKCWQQALESGFRAGTTADDPHNAWYNLSSLYARENQFDATERSLRRAIASSPTWFKPHWMLAQVLSVRGRRDEAEKEAKIAAYLNAGKNPEVAETLVRIQANDK